jgi:prepilin-type N-terminal cleavage/methylation domain-containing protein
MKLLLDENLSRRLVPFLQTEFPDSSQVALIGLERATNLEIWDYARQHGYVIVARDADFEELSTVHGCPPHDIWIRGENMSKATVLNLLLANRGVIEDALSEDGVACIEMGKSIEMREGSHTPESSQRGFTLIELAIVMFIVTLLLGGMLLPLSAQQDVRAYGDTQKILSEARDALLGYAMANDRLPCPASSTSNGVEDPVGGGACAHPYDGFFPAATLGLSPVDSQGYLVDGWGSDADNRIHFSVSTANTSALTTSSGMKNTGITVLAPDLQVCSTGTGMSNAGLATAACASGTALASDAVAVIYSLGKNAGSAGAGAEETHNPNPRSTTTADRVFVNAPQGSASDDQVVWMSKSTLFNRLVTAGRLP